MPAPASSIDPLSAELPDFSVDWRFLLPIRQRVRLLVAGDAGQAFAPYFAGLDVLVVSFLPRESLSSASRLSSPGDSVIFDPAHPPFAPRSFEILAMPFGLPPGLIPHQKNGAFVWDALLKPGGTLLVGAINRWSLWRHRSSSPGKLDRVALQRLLGKAGFQVARAYGVVPNLRKPAYILPLNRRVVAFFLRHRYSGRRARRLLPLLSMPFLAGLLSGLLPGYFLVAQQGEAAA